MVDAATSSPQRIPALIIGAGQAGLAAAHELSRRGLRPGTDFLILDANDGPGGAWRHRWDSLTLGAAHHIADLPGLPLGQADPATPASTVVADYYGRYEDMLQLHVRRPVTVHRVDHAVDDARPALRVHSSTGDYLARVVINATGTWDRPFIPAIPGAETFRGVQLHTRDFERAEHFGGVRTLVVGGGLSAVQFLLELEDITETIWATRRPPNFTRSWQDPTWGSRVEAAVRERTTAGRRPAAVVRTTGIGLTPTYRDAVARGLLVSRGMISRITQTSVIFGHPVSHQQDGLGPTAGETLTLPESWDPLPAGTEVPVDVIFWNTGFRASLRHLAPLRLRGRHGIPMLDEVRPARCEHLLLVGYGSAASTIGATRAGRRAGAAAYHQLMG